MPFHGEDSDEAYSAIKGACANIGLNAKRVSDNVGSAPIINEIIELIDDAEFVVCDLSGERPNVYYELGYAHGSGNEPARILLIAKQGTHLHFDIAPLRVEFYQSTEHLRSIIASKLHSDEANHQISRELSKSQPVPQGRTKIAQRFIAG
jgi:hypothetical protein